MEGEKFRIEKNESIEKIKPQGIIAGTPGIGKTTLIDNFSTSDISVLDLDSSPYRKDQTWPDNYLKKIEEEMRQNNLLLISSYPEIVKELTARGYEVTVVCADENLQDEYRKRYISRGNKPEMVERFIDASFASNKEQTDRFEGSNVVFLQTGQYLSDIIDLPE
ncbi:hypothetical protein H6781_02315 [Candidatus Nomurabacteria bacterium]|nr:hypothetical protein [Candidatus Nomurabacteria bacterium]MCB9818010.1 hypothetical protein [Candidatus Nomurabacteria bacterium]